jgi:hypothetical protein
MYLVKTQYHTRKNDVVLVEDLHASFREKRKPKTTKIGDRTYVEQIHDGYDKSQGSNGLHASSVSVVCPKTAAGLKTCVRKLRAQEAKALADIDREINALKAQIAELREQRTVVVKEAWSKGHVVRVNELEIKQ